MTWTQTAFAAAFLLAMGGFAFGIAWLSIRDDAHSPAALRSESTESQ